MINCRKSIFLLLFFMIMFIHMTRVNGLIPVTYTCCYNYTDSNGIQLDNFEYKPSGGIQLDNFENLINWTIGGTGASQVIDTVNFHDGQKGLKLIASNGNRAYIDKVINNNFSNSNNIAIWIYVYDSTTLYSATVYVTSTGTAWSKYFSADISNLVNGWNKVIIPKEDFTSIYGPGESWNNIMNRIRIAVWPIPGVNTNITLDDLRHNVTNDWKGGYQPDLVNYKEGQQGLKLTTKGVGYSYIDLVINNNFSTTNNFVIWTYVDNANNLSGMSIQFTSNGSSWRKWFYDPLWAPGATPAMSNGVKTGWNKLIFNKRSFKNYFGENWDNVMNRVRIYIYAYATKDVSVTFDDLRYDITGQRAKLIYTFDDGYKSLYTKAYPILSANNQTGVSWVVSSWVGADPYEGIEYMNLSDLKTLQSAGWDISSHTVHHADLPNVSDSTLTSELNDSYDWFIANKFQKSAGFFSYPFGYFNDVVIDKVKQRYILARATIPESAQPHLAETTDDFRYIQRVMTVHNDTSVQEIKDRINDTINAKLLGILYFHNIVDNDTGYVRDYTTSDFQKISDYLKSRSADIDVITYSDYVIPNVRNLTPVINKTTRIYSNGSSVIITKNKYDEYMPNMTVIPLSDYIDINLTTYNETGGQIKFNESSQNKNLYVSYVIGDRMPNRPYLVQIYWQNGMKYQDLNIIANDTGYIRYNSEGFGVPRYQEINLENSIIYNIAHQKYIYQKRDMLINFSFGGYIGTKVNMTVTSPLGNVNTYNVITQYSMENESIIYDGVNELGVYTVKISTTNSTTTSKFEYKLKPLLTFVSASDLHYGYDNDTISSGYTIGRFISDINDQVFFPSPDFVALLGDTVDNVLYNHIANSKASYDTLNVPYYITTGNMESSYNDTNRESIGYRGQTFYNSYGIEYNYTVTKDDYTFIFGGVAGDYPLLTNYAGKSFGDTNYSRWLDNVLAKNMYKPTIAFSHYSAQKVRDFGGEESYGSITRSKFEKYNNVPVEFAGDEHIVGKKETNNITYVIDGAIINQPYVFDYIEIYPDKIQVHTIPYRLDTDNIVQYVGSYWEGYTDSLHTEANYTIGNPDENEFTITLVNITSTKLTNLWNFTTNFVEVPTGKITLGNNIIRNNSVLVNLSAYETRNIINATISSPGNVDMNITTFDTKIKFNESSPNTVQISYNIGDRIPNQTYSVKIYWENGTEFQDFKILANNSGYISYNSEIGNSRYQEIEPEEIMDTSFTVTLPVGYTFLKFNASNSTVTNLGPDGQVSYRPIFNITNVGNINLSFTLNLNDTVNNITTYADLSNNFSTGKIEINASNTTIIPNLNPGKSQNIWMVADVDKAPTMNINRTLIINNN